MQSSTLKPTLLFILIHVQFTCIVCIVFDVSNPTTGRLLSRRAPQNGKYFISQTQPESSGGSHSLTSISNHFAQQKVKHMLYKKVCLFK